jgi:cholesterol transport system auxiliary component
MTKRSQGSLRVSHRLRNRLRIGAAAAALALVAGCSSLLVDNKAKDPSTIYAPDPRVQADPAWPTVTWPLLVANPTAARMVDNLRISVRPSSEEMQIYKGARWAKSPSEMVEDSLLRALEDSGRIASVARQGSGMDAQYKLLLDVRRFESDYAQAAVPSATIEVSAKLLHVRTQQVVAARTFLEARPAASTSVADVVAAFDQSLATVAHDLAGWTLTSGDQHARSAAR